MKTNSIFFIINLLLSFLFSSIFILPWWTFLINTFILGAFFSRKCWRLNSFKIGFISGFINWFFLTLVIHFIYNGFLLEKLSEILFVSPALLLICIAIISGILNGLASFSGYSMFKFKDELNL